MKRIIIFLSTTALLLCINACEKSIPWVYYDETGCSDQWGHANVPDKDKVKNVKEYLKSKQIRVLKVEIANDGTFEPCMACHCKTGKRIKCKINKNDLDKVINENFYQENIDKR